MGRTTLCYHLFLTENRPAVAEDFQNPISTGGNSWSLISDKMIWHRCLENVPGIPNVSSCVVPKKIKPQFDSFTRKFDMGKLPK